MKSLIGFGSWLLAVALAVAVVYRLMRRRNVLLRGTWSPRVVRMVVILLVASGIGLDRAKGQDSDASLPTTSPATTRDAAPAGERRLPEAFTMHVVQKWRRNIEWATDWRDAKRAYLDVYRGSERGDDIVEKLRNILKRHDGGNGAVLALMGPRIQDPVNPRWGVRGDDRFNSMLQVMEALETQSGLYDDWIVALAWTRVSKMETSETVSTRIKFFEHLAEHSRIADTLTLVAASGRFSKRDDRPRAWATKAGPSKEERDRERADWEADFALVSEMYRQVGRGRWEREHLVTLVPMPGASLPTIWRAGRTVDVSAAEPIQLTRLDLVQTPEGVGAVRLEHAQLGTVTLNERSLISLWQLPEHLSSAQIKLVADWVDAALAGNEVAAAQLEDALPLTHRAIREQLRAQPKAPGAPRLRMILAEFDEFSVPTDASSPTTQPTPDSKP